MILLNCYKGEKHNSTGTNGECYAGVKITKNPNAYWEETNNNSEVGLII